MKAPGPNGMPAISYQENWDIVACLVYGMVKSFFHSGHMLKGINKTFITLIPKNENPESVNHYTYQSLQRNVKDNFQIFGN